MRGSNWADEQMTEKMQQLERVAAYLDLVDRLPLGHPDRFRFLTLAQQVLEGSLVAAQTTLQGQCLEARQKAALLPVT